MSLQLLQIVNTVRKSKTWKLKGLQHLQRTSTLKFEISFPTPFLASHWYSPLTISECRIYSEYFTIKKKTRTGIGIEGDKSAAMNTGTFNTNQ